MTVLRHVGIIMDGNGRWAEARGMPRWKGHECGAAAVRRTIEEACRQGISVLTLFAFSSENWKRPAQEVHILFSLFKRFLRQEQADLVRNGIRLSAVGRRDRLPVSVRATLEEVEGATRPGERLHLRLALDYGARHEIAEAARSLARRAARGELHPDQIDERLLGRELDDPAVPDPDLIIRTAGERRLSNFLLWQGAYAELHFTPKLWPDFAEEDLALALDDFRSRTRKFGAVAPAPATGTIGY
ncbi:MAG: di-trans,poly-cis-decaprenylcistransferase [Acidobacteria bacterium]|nr:MAG: di-trans,poly-cis-decaprenylcistransferase [Acidobacteriota bacterium]